MLIIGLSDCFSHTAISSSFSFVVVSIFLQKLVTYYSWASEIVFGIDFDFIGRLKVVMVCQAASQTRFRASKHENGITGRATIRVRFIACFQPLENCQAEYFRQLLKPVT